MHSTTVDNRRTEEVTAFHSRDGVLNLPVLVLNRNYEPLNVVSAKRAIVLLMKGKAEMVKSANGLIIQATRESIPVPSVVRLMVYARRPPARVRLNRRSILIRDDYTCQYCGYHGPGLTIDHVIPKDKGGKTDWDNLVACCTRCNSKKGNRTPEEAGMILRKRPRKPAYLPYMGYAKLMQALRNPDWHEFLRPFVRE
ncbi:MAG: HNH endonuclease [Armatimonadetes bacterium]|nr:HNH endonuclease [Armatimonadota bacterium]MDW8027145.1 HNH endonuclease [Armatimonadota bacterium]